MYTETPDVIPFPTSFKRTLLTQAELETQKGGTLQLLGKVGVHFPSRTALGILSDHGAKVNTETEIIRIASGLIQKAMSTAPRSFVRGGGKSALTCSWIAAAPTFEPTELACTSSIWTGARCGHRAGRTWP